MKKLLLVVFAGMFIGNTYAQDDKSFHAGFRINPALSWLRPDDAKAFENNGMKGSFGLGLMTEFKLAEKFWLSTGIGFDFDGGNIKYLENPSDSIGYLLDDNKILTYESDNGDVTSIDTTQSSEYIRLESRKFRANYVTIPIIFKMKTKEIGMMKYFFQFGTNIGIKTKGRADDTGVSLSSSNTPNLDDLNIDSEMSLIRSQINFGGGVEYNVSGTTWLIGGLDFNWGVTNAVNKNSEHLIDASATFNTSNTSGKYQSYDEQKFLPYNISLRIGVLF